MEKQTAALSDTRGGGTERIALRLVVTSAGLGWGLPACPSAFLPWGPGQFHGKQQNQGRCRIGGP